MYILRCSNDALYTGVTTDVQRRIREHEDKGRLSARFTRAFSPIEIVYSCCVGAKNLTYRIEYRIKKLPREKKSLVISENFSKTDLLKFFEIKE